MTAHTVEAALLGTELARTSAPPRAVMSNGEQAEVGMTVFFTADGAKQVLDEMLKMVDAKGVDDLVVKAATFFGQHVDPTKVSSFTSKISDRIKSMTTTPFVITAVSGENRVDLKGQEPFNRTFSGIPTSLLLTDRSANSILSTLRRTYGPLPLWCWTLAGVGAVSVSAFAVYKIRRS